MIRLGVRFLPYASRGYRVNPASLQGQVRRPEIRLLEEPPGTLEAVGNHPLAEELDKLRDDSALQSFCTPDSRSTNRLQRQAAVNRYHSALSRAYALAQVKGTR